MLQNLVSNPTNGYERNNFAYMISGLPVNWSEDQLQSFVDKVKTGAKYLFFTNVNIEQEDIYASFGSSWEQFVKKLSM